MSNGHFYLNDVEKEKPTTVWQPISTAPSDVGVLTKIDDANGVRNITRLRKIGNLWYFDGGSMYVYYTPTHWAVDGPI